MRIPTLSVKIKQEEVKANSLDDTFFKQDIEKQRDALDALCGAKDKPKNGRRYKQTLNGSLL